MKFQTMLTLASFPAPADFFLDFDNISMLKSLLCYNSHAIFNYVYRITSFPQTLPYERCERWKEH
ncbi:CLUMA_CG018776, isoform A [Clunio marinus]|uniref:CLUMA_CG018776, isoform A n=1 Tax=Clunio marinus TaxID=568069 RepID=A0A1J1IZQ4_9DIPT|nr:CLUMA_CG018776, isoform A [Clunio marinus]